MYYLISLSKHLYKGVLLLFPGYKWGICGTKQLRTLSRTIWYHLKNLTLVTWLFFCFLSTSPKYQRGKVAMAKPLFNNNLFPGLFTCMRSLWRKGKWELQEAISLVLEKGPGWPEGEPQGGEVRHEICTLGTHLPLPVLEQNHFMPWSQNVLIYRITL